MPTYGHKYVEEFTSQIFGTEYKLIIAQRDYSGSIYTPLLSANPVTLQQDEGDYIRGTSLEIRLIAETQDQYREFYTTDATLYKIILQRKDDSGTYQDRWKGFIVPEQYAAPWTAPPYIVTFTATDQLGLLKENTFHSGYGLTGKVSQLAVITAILNNFNELTYIEIGTYDHATGMNTSRSALAQAYLNVEYYYEQEQSCYAIIEDILKQYDAYLTQAKYARWIIQTRDYDYTELRPYYRTSDLAYINSQGPETQGTYGYQINTIANADLEIAPALKSIRLIHELTPLPSFIPNSDFKDWSGNVPTGWNDPDSIINPAVVGSEIIALDGSTDGNLEYIYSPETAELESPSGPLVLETKGSIGGLINQIGGEGTHAHQFKLMLTGTNNTYYWTGSSWSTTNSTFGITHYVRETDQYSVNSETKERTEAIDPLPETGTLTLYIYNMEDISVTMHYANLKFDQLPEKTDSLVEINPSAIQTSEREFMITDVKINEFPNNSDSAFRNTLTTQNGGELQDWDGNGGSLLEALIDHINAYKGNSREKIRGKIIGDNLFSEYIKLSEFDENDQIMIDKIYEINERAAKLVEDTMDVTLTEIIDLLA
jgi:hypothetical protein